MIPRAFCMKNHELRLFYIRSSFKLFFFAGKTTSTVPAHSDFHWVTKHINLYCMPWATKVLPQIGIPVHLLKPCGQAAKASTGTDDMWVLFPCGFGAKYPKVCCKVLIGRSQK